MGAIFICFSVAIVLLPETKKPPSSKQFRKIDHATTVSGADVNSRSRQGKTTIEPQVKIMQSQKKLNSPILFTAFPGPGFVGCIAASYIINKSHMTQIACIESQFIVPGVISAEGGIRHPFRLYSNTEGTICVLICEAPIMIQGMYLILDSIVKWAQYNKVKKIIALDGISIGVSTLSSRIPIILSEEDSNPEETPGSSKKERPITKKKQEEKREVRTVYSAPSFIAGMSSGLLSCCISNGIDSGALLLPSSRGVEDIEGATILIESLNKVIDDKTLKIDTSQLRKEAENMRAKGMVSQGRSNLWVGPSTLYNQVQSQILFE